jgi:hypothetical protein
LERLIYELSLDGSATVHQTVQLSSSSWPFAMSVDWLEIQRATPGNFKQYEGRSEEIVGVILLKVVSQSKQLGRD